MDIEIAAAAGIAVFTDHLKRDRDGDVNAAAEKAVLSGIAFAEAYARVPAEKEAAEKAAAAAEKAAQAEKKAAAGRAKKIGAKAAAKKVLAAEKEAGEKADK